MKGRNELLQTLWSDVLWKAKRNPTKENFDEVDVFTERHKIFFEASILESFSYDALFIKHFPRRYKDLEAAEVPVNDWAEKFLSTCEEAYTCDDVEFTKVRRDLFLTIKNNDLERLIKMFATNRKYIYGLVNTNDFVELVSVYAWCHQTHHDIQLACNEMYKYILAETSCRQEPLSSEALIKDAIHLLQPLSVIQALYNKIDNTPQMTSNNSELLFDAC